MGPIESIVSAVVKMARCGTNVHETWHPHVIRRMADFTANVPWGLFEMGVLICNLLHYHSNLVEVVVSLFWCQWCLEHY